MDKLETYTPAEAAKVLKCHEQTVRDLIKKGRLTAGSGIGRSYIITRQAIEALIEDAQNRQRQASQAERSKKACQSASELMGSGIVILPTRMASALEDRCKQLTSGRRKNCTTR